MATIESTGRLTGFADTDLFYRTRSADADTTSDGTPRGTVIISHGYAEHSGRYSRLMEALGDAGWNSFAFDHRGHGRSEGLPGFVLRINHCVRDLGVCVDRIRGETTGPVVLFGHSMGGAIVARYVASHGSKVDGMVTSGMFLRSTTQQPLWKVIAAHLIDFFLPALAVEPFDVTGISRDPAVVAAYRNDPDIYHGNVRVRTGLELLHSYRTVTERAGGITIPALLLHGGADPVSDPETTREVYASLASERKTLKIYDGLFHEILNEPESDEVRSDIVDWLAQEFPVRSDR